MLADQLFGSPAAATAICGQTQRTADFTVALTFFNRILDLLIGNGFTQTNVHF